MMLNSLGYKCEWWQLTTKHRNILWFNIFFKESSSWNSDDLDWLRIISNTRTRIAWVTLAVPFFPQDTSPTSGRWRGLTTWASGQTLMALTSELAFPASPCSRKKIMSIRLFSFPFLFSRAVEIFLVFYFLSQSTVEVEERMSDIYFLLCSFIVNSIV